MPGFRRMAHVPGVRARPRCGHDGADSASQPGDMVTAVNGIPVDSPSRAAQIMATLQGREQCAGHRIARWQATELNVGMQDLTQERVVIRLPIVQEQQPKRSR